MILSTIYSIVMKRKTAKNRSSKKVNNTYRNYALVVIAAVAVFLLVTLFVKSISKIHVLGAATGPVLLADQGDQPDSNQNVSVTPEPTAEVRHVDQGDATVDCVGPDGKHLTVSFNACQELNRERNNFHFTPLDKQDKPEPVKQETQNTERTQNRLEVQTEGNKGELNLETANMHVEVKREDNGSIKITAKKPDGTELQLQTNALDQINEALKEKDVEVSTASANGFAIRSAGVQAETNFPLSIDPTTKSLAVTTPNGTKVVTTLPNQAVANALLNGHLSSVLSTADQTTPSASSASNMISLTELNNQPVYAVQGVLSKNLLGIFPVAFRKTVYVSAQDGSVVQVQQSLLNQILQALSF